MVAVLRDTNPADKATVYAELGISMTYHPDGRVLVESRPPCSQVSVGGGTSTPTTRSLFTGEYLAAA
jgi:hypothetical protein